MVRTIVGSGTTVSEVKAVGVEVVGFEIRPHKLNSRKA